MFKPLDTVGNLVASQPLILLVPALIVPILLYTLYRKCLPKPIPGIPYNRKSRGILGDVPSLLSHINKTGEVWSWHAAQNIKHTSAIVQIFPQPFSGKPTIVLTDLLEAQDILLRRNDEFDRSPTAASFLKGVVPEGMFPTPTGSEWKWHRGLSRDNLTPDFLNNVSAPTIYHCAEEVVGLWRTKTKLASGMAFSAAMDIHHCSLDAIFNVAFGDEDSLGIIQTRRKYVESLDKGQTPPQPNGSVTISDGSLPDTARAIIDISDSIEITIRSPFPGLANRVLRWVPWFSNAWKTKERLFRYLLEKSRDRVERKTAKEQHIRCALDNMVARELNMSSRDNRSPRFHSRGFYDEMFTFIVGGYDTTSTTTQWAVKFLAQNPIAQSKLRTALKTSLSEAAASKRQPTVEEIIRASDPYIDAVLEELIRHSITLPGTMRTAKCDTNVLGRPIPKGTDIIVLSNGAGSFSPGFDVPEALHSDSTKAAVKDGRAYRSWDPTDLGAFKPERWLNTDEKGETYFNKMAGLHLTFGLGHRGCWGRRIAQLEFRIFISLFVWNFYFKPLEGDLADDSYMDKLTRVPNKCFIKVEPCF